MADDLPNDAPTQQNVQISDKFLMDSVEVRRPPQSSFFLYGGILFLVGALFLFLLAAYLVFQAAPHDNFTKLSYSIDLPSQHPAAETSLSSREMYEYFARILAIVFAPFTCIFSAILCSVIGIRLLRAAGVATTQVIAPQDFPVLGPAVRDANEGAITQFIRLSSLSGTIGMFTKIGLTGLPLATIFLTVFLAVLGLLNPQFFELAKLTLGAFLGSFVQRQTELTRTALPQSGQK